MRITQWNQQNYICVKVMSVLINIEYNIHSSNVSFFARLPLNILSATIEHR